MFPKAVSKSSSDLQDEMSILYEYVEKAQFRQHSRNLE